MISYTTQVKCNSYMDVAVQLRVRMGYFSVVFLGGKHVLKYNITDSTSALCSILFKSLNTASLLNHLCLHVIKSHHNLTVCILVLLQRFSNLAKMLVTECNFQFLGHCLIQTYFMIQSARCNRYLALFSCISMTFYAFLRRSQSAEWLGSATVVFGTLYLTYSYWETSTWGLEKIHHSHPLSWVRDDLWYDVQYDRAYVTLAVKVTARKDTTQVLFDHFYFCRDWLGPFETLQKLYWRLLGIL